MNKHPAKQVQGCRTYQVATLVVALSIVDISPAAASEWLE